MLVTSTNSEVLAVRLYIHSVMTIWPGTAAEARVARAKVTTLTRSSSRMASASTETYMYVETCPIEGSSLPDVPSRPVQS
jgi:hypothetical protein